MANFTVTVGPTGRSFTTLQAAWNSLPATIAAGDNYDITMAAGLYTAGLDVASSAKTLNGTVTIKPEVGAAWYEASGTPNIPIQYDNTKGVAIEASPFLRPVLYIQSNVLVTGLQIKGGGDKGGIDVNGSATNISISRNVFSSDSANFTGVNLTGATSGNVFNNVFITTNLTAPAFRANDTNGIIISLIGNTFIAVGGGAAVWNAGQYGAGLRVRDNAVFGFSGSATSLIDTANSSNNATDAATFPGTNNALSLVVANQFINPTATGTLDLRPKAGNGLQVGIANALITTDLFGATRAAPPTIGAIEYIVSAADTTLPIMTGALTVSGVSSSGFTVDWSGTTRTDNVAVTGYEYSINGGAYVNAGTATSQVFSSLVSSTSYTVTVRDYDAAGNRSTPALSVTQSTTASGDTIVPTMNGTIAVTTITSSGFTLGWSTGSDNVAVTGYEYSTDGGTTYINVGNVLTAVVTGKSPSTAYAIRVRDYDAAGNRSIPLSASVTTADRKSVV